MSTVQSSQTSRVAAGSSERSQQAIHVRGAEVVFRRRRRGDAISAIKDLDLSIPPGTVFCLLGPNGSGKTTAINLLNGLLRPTRGEVRVLGLDPVGDRRDLLRRIAVVPQETALYEELTGYENLRFHASYYGVPPSEQDERIDRALELVSLSDAASNRVSTYSGGMRRRIALGRALLTNPEVFFLDEPTLGVDVQSRQAIWERIEEIADSGRTVFLTTNYMEEAEHLGREVLIIDGGQPVVGGRPGELKARVDRRRLTIEFGSVQDAGEAAERLSPSFAAELDGDVVHVEIADDAGYAAALRSVLDALGDAAGTVAGVRSAAPSLQDVFLHYTGRSLRD